MSEWAARTRVTQAGRYHRRHQIARSRWQQRCIALKCNLGKAELKAEFVQLRAKGLPYVRIAERLGVAKSTLANWNAELEAEIASARAMELEALQDEFFLLKEGRITLLGEQLQRLRGELASRDLTEVSDRQAPGIAAEVSCGAEGGIRGGAPALGPGAGSATLAWLIARHPELDETGPKMNSEAIAKEMELVFLRCRAGLISADRAAKEVACCRQCCGPAVQVDLERKVDALQATLAARRSGRADGMADRRTLNQLLGPESHRQGDRPAGPAELHGRAGW